MSAPRDLDELITLYADDPASLTPEERARVEAGPAAEVDETRALLGRIRALREPKPPAELARDILRAVDAEEERTAKSPWRWLRRGWRPVLGIALAATAIAIVVVARRADAPAPTRRAHVIDAGVPVVPPPVPAPTPDPEVADAPLALGAEGDIAAEDLVDEVADEVLLALGGDDWTTPAPIDGLVPDLTLDWVDDLDEEDLEAIDQWLGTP
jgi:hypothetical protein